jgi:hypothetical protein
MRILSMIVLCAVAGMSCISLAAPVVEDGSYTAVSALGDYGVPAGAQEVALARSAVPASIAAGAEVLTLGRTGYETAVRGHNGFVCLVERSWAAGLNEKDFWNPQLRAPICMNPAAARSVLPPLLERTRWVLAGASRQEMMERTRRAVAAHTYTMPEPGAMAYMLSNVSTMDDAGGHWHPHLMFFVPHIDPATWGGNLEGSGVFAAQGDPEPVTTLFMPVPKWSDGTVDVALAHEGH